MPAASRVDLPEPGTPVTGSLDWERRFRFMRLHTALHALSGIVWTGWNADVTGSNISDNGERARMDFSLEGIRINEIKQEIEDRLNESLAAGREVKVYELPREEAFQLPDLIRTHVNLVPEHIRQIRIVEIVDLDRQADGGTHVANTAEVGPVRTDVHRDQSPGAVSTLMDSRLRGNDGWRLLRPLTPTLSRKGRGGRTGRPSVWPLPPVIPNECEESKDVLPAVRPLDSSPAARNDREGTPANNRRGLSASCGVPSPLVGEGQSLPRTRYGDEGVST